MKKVIFLSLSLLLIILLLTPVLLGQMIRAGISDLLRDIPESEVFDVTLTDTRVGWFTSEIGLLLEGSMFAETAGAPAAIPATLELTHGPLIWNLADSLFAVASVNLRAADQEQGSGARHNLSGSALLRLDRSGNLRLAAILGFVAFDGDHLIELRARWPMLASLGGWENVQNVMHLDFSVDMDARALAQSPLADTLQLYQRQGWTRMSSGRALTYIMLRNGLLDINGQVMPVAHFSGSPAGS